MLADIGILEKGNAAEVGGVSAALRTNQNTSGFLLSNLIYTRRVCSHRSDPDHQW